MKKLLLLSLILILSSCGTTQLEEWSTSIRSSGFDFRDYTEQGFLFTPEVYTGSYDAIGLVEVTYIPRVLKAPGTSKPSRQDGYYVKTAGVNHYLIELPDTKMLIDEMYALANDLGADALSNFRITSELVTNNGYDIETVKVTGFAIKRL